MNKKGLFGGLVAVSGIAVVVAVLATKLPSNFNFEHVRADGYSCASIKFGMKDSNCTAVTYDPTSPTTNLNGCYSTDVASQINTITASYVYEGGDYTYAGDHSEDYERYAIRIGKSKTKGTATFTFKKNIVGCVVYALPYVGKSGEADVNEPVTMVVNGQEVDLSEVQGPTSKNKASATIETYTPYTFSFAATDTLTLTSKIASTKIDGKTVSASRYYVANIALRFAA